MSPNAEPRIFTLPIRERVPGHTPLVSGKHRDGCDHDGGFHDGLRELYSSGQSNTTDKVTLPTQNDLATFLKLDKDMAASSSDAAQLIDNSQSRVGELNAQLDSIRAHGADDSNKDDGNKDDAVSVTVDLPGSWRNSRIKPCDTVNGQPPSTTCPGCVYDTAAESVFDDMCVQTARGRWGRRVMPKENRLSMAKEKAVKAVRGCRRKMASLTTRGSGK